MYEILKILLKQLSIIFLVCFLVSGATELCIVIDEDHFITNRNGTNEHVIDLLDEGSVGQEVLVNMTRNINIATSIDVNNANEVSGYICWRITENNGEKSRQGRVSVLDYDFGTWTNIVVDASGLSNNNALIEIWTEEVQGLDNIILIVSESPQAFQYGNFYVSGQKTEGALAISFFSFRGLRECLAQFVMLFIALSVIVLIILGIIFAVRREPIVILLLLRWGITYLINQPYQNFNNQFGYTLWMYSFQKLGLATRILPGTILKLFNNVIGKYSMLNAGLFCQVISLLVLILVFYKILNKSNGEKGEYLNLLTLLYIVSPVCITYYIYPNFFIHYDELLLICFVISTMLSSEDSKYKFLIPIICGCAMLTHEMFILLCYPWLFSYLVYTFTKKKKKEDLIIIVFSAFVVSGLFIYTVLLPNNHSNDLNSLLELLQRDVKDEGLISPFYVSSYYTMSSQDKLIMDHYDAFRFHGFTNLLMGIIVSFPLIFIAIRFFYSVVRNGKDVWQKLSVFLFPLSSMGVVVACYKACDFGRWAVMAFACMLLVMFFMIYSGDKIEIDAIEYAINPYKKILGNKWKCILCVYLLLIEIGGTQGISKLSVYLTNYLTKLIS